jgi:hypothetical protein
MATRRRGGVQEAVSTFSSLLKYGKGTAPSGAQKKARADFPERVSQGKLTLRNPSEPIPRSGKHFIIGIATYSPDELHLLDQVENSLENVRNRIAGAEVEVFDVLDCLTMSDFERYIPGIDNVHRTPVIGVIVDGKLIDRATGLAEVTSTLRRFNVLSHS